MGNKHKKNVISNNFGSSYIINRKKEKKIKTLTITIKYLKRISKTVRKHNIFNIVNMNKISSYKASTIFNITNKHKNTCNIFSNNNCNHNTDRKIFKKKHIITILLRMIKNIKRMIIKKKSIHNENNQ